ncbi:SRPBCC family protein [Antrihabitans cavernicola]|uniref:SRPBCC family protein n=1 Tax=Antrihabitans cavernicola TaxID=2495913 RepID=A0A5A7S5G0_9NOCA|nr:SRPBCC family protein [Spelaeibacter cavernicola]KAA0021410.1 SRPBCC family protein [Spelaeibacter cavernicola]
MTEYCAFEEPNTLRIERDLRGPIERVWQFLTEPERRKTWMSAGEIEPRVGGQVEHVFRNAELIGEATEPVDEYRFGGRVLAYEPPRLLAYTWDRGSDVTFELTPVGDRVRLVVTHRRIADRDGLVGYGSGWHAHLDLLVHRLADDTPTYDFQAGMAALQAEYAQRFRVEAPS